MEDKPKCSKCNERDVFSKGLCSGCYGRQWREQRKAEQIVAPAQLTDGVIDGEVVSPEAAPNEPPKEHLVALNPVEMQEARGDLKVWLEQKLAVLERDIREANAALGEARRNGWATAALTSARNRAVDDETFYNKILVAVEAGYTVIPEFPINVFAVRAGEQKEQSQGWLGHPGENTYLNRPVQPSSLPAGAGEYRNPAPEVQTWSNGMRKDGSGNEVRHWMQRSTGEPASPITFPTETARAPIMKATADAMADKTFDQIGVCFPVMMVSGSPNRQVQTTANRAGDPLVIGQIVRKRVGSRQKVVSFIIAWHIDLRTL